MSDDEFTSGAGDDTNLGTPVEASSLGKNSHIICKDRPCKIEDISKSKPGKHGSAKLSFKVVDIFTGKKYEMIKPAHDMVISPTVKRDEYQLVDIDGDFMSMLLESGELKEVRLPPDDKLASRITELFQSEADVVVSIQSCNNEELCVSARTIDASKLK